MRRILALAAVAVAVSVAPSQASYVGPCTGQVDTNCTTWVCTGNCFQRTCTLYVHLSGLPVLCLSQP